MNVLSLFSGIGGLELGLERAGMTVIGQVEIDPFCRRVLETHWPEVPKHDDVRTAVQWWRSEPRPAVHVVAGGFPCQPFSEAGSRAGVADERWGWPWMRDVIAAVRPWHVVAENVAALLRDTEAFRIILGDLSELGFSVEWSVVSACSVGAPHTRERLFVVAHADAGGQQAGRAEGDRDDETVAVGRVGSQYVHAAAEPGGREGRAYWPAEPDVGRMADGLSPDMDRSRLKSLGNAVVPQVAEQIGRLIVAAELREVA